MTRAARARSPSVNKRLFFERSVKFSSSPCPPPVKGKGHYRGLTLLDFPLPLRERDPYFSNVNRAKPDQWNMGEGCFKSLIFRFLPRCFQLKRGVVDAAFP